MIRTEIAYAMAISMFFVGFMAALSILAHEAKAVKTTATVSLTEDNCMASIGLCDCPFDN